MARSRHPLSLISALTSPGERGQAARQLAESLGAEDLILFIRDPEIGVLLPAPGFQQTLPSGKIWRALLNDCLTQGELTTTAARFVDRHREAREVDDTSISGGARPDNPNCARRRPADDREDRD